jgi:glycosyltransferase involved in cell wall biosynthesis
MPPSYGGLNRHHYFSRYLSKAGCRVKIFTASRIHNSDINILAEGRPFCEKIIGGVNYTFVRTGGYSGNGLSRVRNMLEFPLRIWGVVKRFVALEGKPDVVYTSSPDIFACFGAMLIAVRLKIPCIFEVRDLWPESIVAYGKASAWNPLIWAMFRLEGFMYRRADRLIFTMEGAKDYLIERGLARSIDMTKVHHINNGVDIEEFDRNEKEHPYRNPALEGDESFKAVYAGSIRHVNNIEELVAAAEILQSRRVNIRLILFGDGDRAGDINKLIKEKRLRNITLERRVDRKYIPSILRQADACILHFKQSPVMRYGLSANKLFDYLAAGKPVFSDLSSAYDVIERFGCGLSIGSQSPEAIADGIEGLVGLPGGVYRDYCENARLAAEQYDYRALSKKLLDIIDGVLK